MYRTVAVTFQCDISNELLSAQVFQDVPGNIIESNTEIKFFLKELNDMILPIPIVDQTISSIRFSILSFAPNYL